jgi:hypothetical protein
MENNIEHYFIKHLTDKFESKYHEVYNTVLGPIRNDEITLLEIGLGTITHGPSNMISWKEQYIDYKPGASLRAFKDYFQKGLIYGMDIQHDCMFNEDRIDTFLCDSREKKQCDDKLNEMKFDVIIDDGDHSSEGQIKTFLNLFGRVKSGGYYFIEDVAFLEDIKSYFESTTYDYEFHNRLLVIKKI